MTAMDITIHASFLPHNDPDASLAFYRDTLGFEVRNDVGYGGKRRVTGRPAHPPRTAHLPEAPPPPPLGGRVWVSAVRFAPPRSSLHPPTPPGSLCPHL